MCTLETNVINSSISNYLTSLNINTFYDTILNMLTANSISGIADVSLQNIIGLQSYQSPSFYHEDINKGRIRDYQNVYRLYEYATITKNKTTDYGVTVYNLNNYLNFFNIAKNNYITPSISNNTIITINMYILLLKQFIQILNNLYMLTYNIYIKNCSFTGSIYNYVSNNPYYFQDIPVSDHRYGYMPIILGPYAKKYFSKINSTSYIYIDNNDSNSNSNNIIQPYNDGISLINIYSNKPSDNNKNIIYTTNKNNINQTQFILNDLEGTNGLLSINKHVNVLHNDILDNIDIIKLFNLYKNTIITSRQIEQCISYIKYIWEQNISSIEYTFNVCHSNCHSNGGQKNLKYINFINIKYVYTHEYFNYCSINNDATTYITDVDQQQYNIKLQIPITDVNKYNYIAKLYKYKYDEYGQILNTTITLLTTYNNINIDNCNVTIQKNKLTYDDDKYYGISCMIIPTTNQQFNQMNINLYNSSSLETILTTLTCNTCSCSSICIFDWSEDYSKFILSNDLNVSVEYYSYKLSIIFPEYYDNEFILYLREE